MIRTILAFVVLILAMTCPHPTYARPPEKVIEAVYFLSETSALVDICLESSKGKRLSAEEALDYHGYSIRIYDLVEKISNIHKDQTLIDMYEISQYKMKNDPEYIKYSKNEYGFCSNKLKNELNSYINGYENAIK